MGRLYGHARVSSADQNVDRQVRALRAQGVGSRGLYVDHASGRDFDRPAWRALVSHVAPGDTLVVSSIDRLGRNYDEVLVQWRLLTKERRVAVRVLDMPLLDTDAAPGDITGTLIADIMLQLLSYVAQVERENIHRRQAEGIAAAKARGVRFGRPKKPLPPGWDGVRDSYLRGAITRKAAAESLGVCVSTFDRWLARERLGDEKRSSTHAVDE